MLLIHIIVVVKSEHEYINSCFCTEQCRYVLLF